MQKDELAFEILLSKEREELQETVNKLILDFEQKYYFEGVRLQIKLTSGQDEMNAEKGRLKFILLTGMKC